MTGASLERLTDMDMYTFIEEGIRGGVSVASQRYAKANIPGTAEHDASIPNEYLIYLDENNLYGWAMKERLPYKDFKWMDGERRDSVFGPKFEKIQDLADESERGYILKVDLKYPPAMHVKHQDYPMAPERMRCQPDMLSTWQREEIAQQLGVDNDETLASRMGKTAEKLIPNVHDKCEYVLHYRTLKFYLAQGLEITKIHQAVEFEQSNWLAPYIDFNTARRAVARNNFEKDFFKLMNNAVYGKTLENVRNRRKIDLVTDVRRLRKLAAQPTFKNFTIFHENLVAIERYPARVKLDKPIYTGLTVLDLSKLLMYQWHYEKMPLLFPADDQSYTLLYTDTDSLIYSVKTDDIYSDFRKQLDLFDFSSYEPSHPCYQDNPYIQTNKKRIGVMKDELDGLRMAEFVALRSKVYSYTLVNEDQAAGEAKKLITRKSKGVSRVATRAMEHSDYVNCLFDEKKLYASMTAIRSKKHQIFTLQQTKLALNYFDDKRHIYEDRVRTLPYGHKDI